MSNDNIGLTCSGPDDVWPISRKYALYTAVIIFLLGMFDLISRQVIVSLFPHIKEEFSLSDKQLGMLVASVNVAISVLVVPTAYLVDRWSRKKMIFLMGVVWSLSTLLGGFVTSFSHLLIARMLCGFGEAGYQPAGQSLLTACFPRKFRATATAIVTCGMTIGAPIGLVVGAFVAEHWGWRHAFGVVAVPGLLLSFLALRMHDFKVSDDSGEKAARHEKRKGRFIPAVRNIVKTPTIVCVILCAVCIRLFNSVLMTWLPTYFTRVAEVPMTTAGSYASLIILMSSLAVFYGGPLLDWLKNRNERLVPLWLTFVMFLSGLLNFTAYTFLRPGSLEQVALLVISGCFFGTLLAAGSFLILDLTSATSRATAISLMILSQNLLGYGLGPIVTGTLSDMFSISFAMTAASMILFVGGAIYAVCIFTYPRDKKKAECVDITFHAQSIFVLKRLPESSEARLRSRILPPSRIPARFPASHRAPRHTTHRERIMKKLILSLAAAFTLLFPAASSAVDVRVHGRYLWSMSYLDHMNIIDPLNREVQGSRFQAYQRLRLWFDMAVSENLTAVLNLEVPRTLQGSLGVGGPGSEVTAREAYLSWKVPNTESRVNMGRFWFHMPSYTFDTPILNEPVDGVMVNIPLGDNYDLNVAWLRPQAETAAWGTAHTSDSSADFGFLSLTAGYENLKVTPWVMGGSIGSHVFKNTVSATPGAQYNPRTPYTSYPRAAMHYGQQEGGWALGFFGDETPASGSTTVWMAGFGAELGMFDPFTIRADFYYGGNDASGGAAREGWYAALGADLKTSGWGRPFIRGWYASGDDGGTKKSGRAPVFEGQGYFNAASGFFYDNTLLCPTIINRNPNGTWGVQFGVKDLALFSPKITHQLSATWIRGNNSVTRAHYRAPEGSPKKFAMAWEDSPVGYMTTADSALVLDFITEWRLYRNLSFAPLISYIISDFDTSEDRWGSKYDANGFRCTLSFNYAF